MHLQSPAIAVYLAAIFCHQSPLSIMERPALFLPTGSWRPDGAEPAWTESHEHGSGLEGHYRPRKATGRDADQRAKIRCIGSSTRRPPTRVGPLEVVRAGAPAQAWPMGCIIVRLMRPSSSGRKGGLSERGNKLKTATQCLVSSRARKHAQTHMYACMSAQTHTHTCARTHTHTLYTTSHHIISDTSTHAKRVVP